MNDIKALSDRDHVRTRPGMYIGATDEPSVAVREIIDNSIDEILGGRADSIWVYSDQLVSDTGSKLMRYTVADNGGGIPIKATVNQSGEEITMTELGTGSLRAGSKFNKTEIQSGTHGVGTSVVMILSSEFQIYSRLSCTDLKLSTKWVQDEVARLKLSSRKKSGTEYSDLDHYYYKLSYSDGYKVDEEIVKIDEDEILSKYFIDIHPSTVTSFIPHPDIWHTQNCKIPMNTRYLKYKCLKDGIETHFFINGEEIMDLPKSYDYEFKCRIDNKEVGTKNDFMEFYVSMGISEKLDDPNKDYSVNTLSTQTGHHVRILNKAYEMAFESVFGDCNGAAGMGIDILCIFTCPEPSYSSQTKERLSDIPGFSVYAEYPRLVKAFVKVINENIEVFKANHERIIEYLRSKDNWSRLSEIKSKLMLAADTGGSHRSVYKPRGLKDCTCRDRMACELIICFTGDTEILDCNNNRISFKDLTEMIKDGKSVYTLSCDENGVKYPSKITWAGITGKSDKMVKVNLDNGTSFTCTPDHKIMMRDGSYKEAKDLYYSEFCMPISTDEYHRVSYIEWVIYDEPIDTYCLRVDNDLHNFPLANGIFVHNCEGRSALGSLTKARAGMNNIALLGLRGRPKNVSGMDITDVLENDEMYDLINAIGVGVNDYHSLDQVRYGKVIINSDGDADGLAIAALVLGTILEHMTFLIPAGMVYIARCPLYAQGDKYYYYGEEHLVDFSKPTKRWKGLGEMNPDELKKVSIDPNTRSLIKVTLDNIDYCRALLSSTTARKELMLGKGIITEDQLQPFNIMTDGNGDYDHDQ